MRAATPEIWLRRKILFVRPELLIFLTRLGVLERNSMQWLLVSSTVSGASLFDFAL